VKSCGCLKSTRTAQESLIHSVFTDSYNDATLTENQFITLASLPCHWCQAPPSNTRYHRNNKSVSFTYNGLDRIDNTKGHDFDNVRPCCWDCNNFRSNRTVQRFEEKIIRIYLNMMVADSGTLRCDPEIGE
jgi:catalase (peroxidase I)